jgi:glycine cleavage system aminomethyltransferase T
MTDAWVLLSIWGPKAIEVLQRLFPVDLDRPEIKNPFYLVTRWHALVVQLLNFKGYEPGFLLATDRSQGQNLFDGLFSAGRYLGLKSVGLRSWEQWFKRIGFPPRS